MRLYGLLVLCFAMAALLFFGTSRADETLYDLDRVIEHPGIEVKDIEGYAVIFDSGPYTEIEAIVIDVAACLDGGFSPRPNCEPLDLYISDEMAGYALGGRTYYLADGEPITFIRRGSVETGDPSLIVIIDGTVLVFSEVL